jgi:hypothetical protein
MPDKAATPITEQTDPITIELLDMPAWFEVYQTITITGVKWNGEKFLKNDCEKEVCRYCPMMYPGP